MAIIEGDEGPFIDGAGYYRPEAIDKLEAYHSAVLEYRRRGIEGLPPLPEIEGVTGRIVSSVAARAIEPAPEPEPEPVDAAQATPTSADVSRAGLIPALGGVTGADHSRSLSHRPATMAA